MHTYLHTTKTFFLSYLMELRSVGLVRALTPTLTDSQGVGRSPTSPITLLSLPYLKLRPL